MEGYGPYSPHRFGNPCSEGSADNSEQMSRAWTPARLRSSRGRARAAQPGRDRSLPDARRSCADATGRCSRTPVDRPRSACRSAPAQALENALLGRGERRRLGAHAARAAGARQLVGDRWQLAGVDAHRLRRRRERRAVDRVALNISWASMSASRTTAAAPVGVVGVVALDRRRSAPSASPKRRSAIAPRPAWSMPSRRRSRAARSSGASRGIGAALEVGGAGRRERDLADVVQHGRQTAARRASRQPGRRPIGVGGRARRPASAARSERSRCRARPAGAAPRGTGSEAATADAPPSAPSTSIAWRIEADAAARPLRRAVRAADHRQRQADVGLDRLYRVADRGVGRRERRRQPRARLGEDRRVLEQRERRREPGAVSDRSARGRRRAPPPRRRRRARDGTTPRRTARRRPRSAAGPRASGRAAPARRRASRPPTPAVRPRRWQIPASVAVSTNVPCGGVAAPRGRTAAGRPGRPARGGARGGLGQRLGAPRRRTPGTSSTADSGSSSGGWANSQTQSSRARSRACSASIARASRSAGLSSGAPWRVRGTGFMVSQTRRFVNARSTYVRAEVEFGALGVRQ